MYKHQRYLLSVLMLITLSACDTLSEPTSLFEQYSQRLARVLEYDEIKTPIPPLQRLPRLRERRYDIPELNINMQRFLSLYGCELQVLVGERNSILGKVMLPLNQLDYDVRFIELAQACQNVIDDTDIEMQTLLNQSIDYKRTQLPLSIWNALWADNEIATFLSYSHGYYPVKNANIDKQYLTDALAKQLDQLDAVMTSQQTRLDKQGLLQLQNDWLYQQKVGQLLASMHMVTHKLNDATEMINQRMQRQPICYKQKTNPKAERIRQFFFNFYIVHIQTYFAVVHQHAELLLPQLNRMALIHTAPSPVFEHYRYIILDPANPSGLWQQFELAIEQHTKAWQRLLSHCGMQPGQNQAN